MGEKIITHKDCVNVLSKLPKFVNVFQMTKIFFIFFLKSNNKKLKLSFGRTSPQAIGVV